MRISTDFPTRQLLSGEWSPTLFCPHMTRKLHSKIRLKGTNRSRYRGQQHGQSCAKIFCVIISRLSAVRNIDFYPPARSVPCSFEASEFPRNRIYLQQSRHSRNRRSELVRNDWYLQWKPVTRLSRITITKSFAKNASQLGKQGIANNVLPCAGSGEWSSHYQLNST